MRTAVRTSPDSMCVGPASRCSIHRRAEARWVGDVRELTLRPHKRRGSCARIGETIGADLDPHCERCRGVAAGPFFHLFSPYRPAPFHAAISTRASPRWVAAKFATMKRNVAKLVNVSATPLRNCPPENSGFHPIERGPAVW